uniref:Importin-7/11-like TPR repeats domain-containing protein n=1 Tax=Glossina palpalis gambiensis TaxID=67801 RepID=A0A1B0APL9_9MUSC
MLEQMVNATRDIPEKMRPFQHSVIVLSTDVKEPCRVYLIAEGLSLWLAIVENSPIMSNALIELCRNIVSIMESFLEYLRTILILAEIYILLDAHVFPERYGRAFIEIYASMFDDIRAQGVALMVKVLTADFNYKIYHYARYRQVSLIDLVHKISLSQYMSWQLNTLRTQLDEEAYQQLTRSVYPAVLERLSKFVPKDA